MTTASSIRPPGTEHREYALGASDRLATEQLDHLATLLDRQSMNILDATGLGAGWRCLEVGAGGGTIAAGLADRVGPDGSVVAVDIDTRRLQSRIGLEVRQHDIKDGVPGGPYDLIHVRLVLMHLSAREQILQSLVDALAPGGWLVIGEWTGPQTTILSSPSPEDTEVFRRVQHAAHNIIGRGVGISYEWARQVDQAMLRVGLRDVETVEYTHTSAGGSSGCLLSLNYIRQLHDPLLATGLTEADLTRYRALMHDPRFRAWFYPFLCSRGRRGAGSVDGSSSEPNGRPGAAPHC
ncbi:methyltransferase domain-containing protein [Microlunatus soli]|uniref:Methyltransferase domain-containing protein n=1 Tax=Microlunatus soli TaxID=630515 RepID=A0A1H1ZCJ6_9ACTN|nr:methyltransferase domain-containing protein [Microlunatus soli]SDT31329.1 Methyltransferase domain-containing protein [Microlunatus soli]